MTFVLDTMIVGFFQRAGREKDLIAAASKCPMAVVDEVLQELESGGLLGGAKFRAWFDASPIEVRRIELGTPAHDVLARLINPQAPDNGLGERASIALVASDASLTFVTHDKGGMSICLREVWEPGERLLGVPVFLRRLFKGGAIEDVAVLDDVISQIQPALKPTWWPEWRASLSASARPGQ